VVQEIFLSSAIFGTRVANEPDNIQRRGRDRMVVGLTTICAINAYHY
jgi:hypothetical protein